MISRRRCGCESGQLADRKPWHGGGRDRRRPGNNWRGSPASLTKPNWPCIASSWTIRSPTRRSARRWRTGWMPSHQEQQLGRRHPGCRPEPTERTAGTRPDRRRRTGRAGVARCSSSPRGITPSSGGRELRRTQELRLFHSRRGHLAGWDRTLLLRSRRRPRRRRPLRVSRHYSNPDHGPDRAHVWLQPDRSER